MLGAHLACSSWVVPSSSTASTSGCTSYARFFDSGSICDRSTSSTCLSSRVPCAPSSEATERARSSASASLSVRMCTTPERRPCGSGPPSRSMSTSSPVTERTTSGPVTKIRPSGPRMTTSVRAGPYAAPPAAGPSTTEICGILPEACVIDVEDQPDRVQRQHALGEPRAAGVPQADDRRPVGQRALVGVHDRLAADLAHRAAHHGRRRSRTPPCACPSIRADGGEHAAAVVLGDQLERALVEQRREPEVRVARVLLTGQLRGLWGPVPEVRWSVPWSCRALPGCGSDAAEGDGDVVAAEAEGVVERRR